MPPDGPVPSHRPPAAAPELTCLSPRSDSAAALEKESGFELESTHVSAFRHAVLNGVWEDAETELAHLNIADPDDLRVRAFKPHGLACYADIYA